MCRGFGGCQGCDGGKRHVRPWNTTSSYTLVYIVVMVAKDTLDLGTPCHLILLSVLFSEKGCVGGGVLCECVCVCVCE